MDIKKSLLDACQSISIVLVFILLITLFSSIGECNTNTHNNKILKRNKQLNQIEQYHLKDGKDIKFIEEIIY